MERLNKVIFKNISKVVALSTEMKEYLINSREGLSNDNVAVIPNWYASDVVYDRNNAKENPLFKDILQKEPLIISYFGNMGIAQDMETILDTIRKLKDNNNVHFLFAGHGNKMDTLKKKLAEERMENTTIFDFLHGKDFSDALAISDAFIVSLESSLNGLCVPSKTYSYMSAGKPILAIMNPNCDISMDLTNHNAGFTVETGQSEALVKHIVTLGNKEISKEMGNNCRDLFLNKFTKDICTNKYVNLINQVLESEACLQTKHY
jgi:glycosyltransferase involved in cell wall biosynthesis